MTDTSVFMVGDYCSLKHVLRLLGVTAVHTSIEIYQSKSTLRRKVISPPILFISLVRLTKKGGKGAFSFYPFVSFAHISIVTLF